MEKTEFTCERCGTEVFSAVPVPGETIWCVECRFIEGIDDPAAKKQMAEFIDAKNGRDRETDHIL